MDKIIVDTSVLVKFFSPDEKDNIADELLNKFSRKQLLLLTVDIGIYELANTLKLSKKAPLQTVYQNISDLLVMEPKIITWSKEIIKNGLILMDKFSLTIYDSIFIAAAEIENIPLLTADYKHHKKNFSKQITHYKDWRL